MSEELSFQTSVHIGLGEAVRRLVRVALMRSQGVYVDTQLAAEENLIMEALNLYDTLNLGFDCNMDGVPDTIEIFAKSAETSCCRIVPDAKPKKARGSSRKK